MLWCLDEIGVNYEPLILASAIMGPKGHISKGGTAYGVVDTPEYRAMNPGGTVPTISDDGFALSDSTAIISYLALKHGPALYGNDLQKHALAVAWGIWTDSSLGPPVSKMMLNMTRLAPHRRDPALVQQGAAELTENIEILEKHLTKQTYLVGDSLTIGDILVGPTVHRALLMHPDLENVPQVRRWHATLSVRAGFQKHVAPREFHFDMTENSAPADIPSNAAHNS